MRPYQGEAVYSKKRSYRNLVIRTLVVASQYSSISGSSQPHLERCFQYQCEIPHRVSMKWIHDLALSTYDFEDPQDNIGIKLH
jgi:hypothetical protein